MYCSMAAVSYYGPDTTGYITNSAALTTRDFYYSRDNLATATQRFDIIFFFTVTYRFFSSDGPYDNIMLY